MKKQRWISRTAGLLALSLFVNCFVAIPVRADEQESAAQEKTSQKAAVPADETGYQLIEICSAEDLMQLKENCHVDVWSVDKKVVLQTDIDMTGRDFDGIPVFNGIFEGNNHLISGLNFEKEGYIVGFFRYIEENAQVRNLTLKGQIQGSDDKKCIGSLCGINYGLVENCHFIGTVNGKDTVGGLTGINESTGTINGCTVKGRISGYYSTGGMAGINHGVITLGNNYASVNDDTNWVENDDEIGTGIHISVDVTEDDTKLYSGVDAGGIAGFSDGVISRCINYGNIGYAHTGYNIGGIAGRQSGIVSLCQNSGSINGRKDIGGIVGQMEPFIEINEADSLRSAVNKLHDLIEKTLDDFQEAQHVISDDLSSLQYYADGAIDSGDAMADKLTDFMDVNIDQINSLMDRMEYVTNSTPEILDDLDAALDAWDQLNDLVKQLNEDLDISGQLEDSPYEETEYSRISLVTTAGGSLRSDSRYPEEGNKVTITVVPDNGYELKPGSLKAEEDNGKAVYLQPGEDDQYTFTMTDANVKVTAEFEYKGMFRLKSNAGGKMASKSSDGITTITAKPANGYDFRGFRVDGTVLTDWEETDEGYELRLEESRYLNRGQDILVEAEFGEKEASYNIWLASSTGGTVTADTLLASEGETVTVRIATMTGYQVDSVKAVGDSGQTYAAEGSKEQAGQYTFCMPAENVTLQAFFSYVNRTDDSRTLYTESSLGGTVTAAASFSEGNTYTITLIPSERYEVPADGICLQIETPNDSSVRPLTLSRSDLVDNEDGTYKYVLRLNEFSSSRPVRVYGVFAEKPESNYHSVYAVSGCGGTAAADSVEAEPGDEVYFAPAAWNGYRLGELKVFTDDNGWKPVDFRKAEDDTRYVFTMPEHEVKITASFVPMTIIMTSDLGGHASYVNDTDGMVTVTVTPDAGYTLQGAPQITGKDGSAVPVAKKNNGTFVYEFDAKAAGDYGRIAMTFVKENKKEAVETSKDEINAAIDDLNETSDKINQSVDVIRAIVENEDGTVREWGDLTSAEQNELLKEILNLAGYVGDAASDASAIMSGLSSIYTILQPYVSDAAENARNDIEAMQEQMEVIIDSLKAAGDGLRDIVNYLNGQPSVQFAKLGDDFQADRDQMYSCLKGMTASLGQLNANSGKYSDILTDDLRAVNDQMTLIFNLLADNMTVSDKEESLEGLYEEVDYSNIEAITTGKVDSCTNKGTIKGDINVGGIAGSMAVDDEDPEDSAAGAVDYELGRKFMTKCVTNNCRNEGVVASKKDGVGGIIGYMRHGIVLNSVNVGNVESTEGDFAGGISGESLAIIQNCSALGLIKGGKNVGGIAGFGSTIENCRSMVQVEGSKGRTGAIAGEASSYNIKHEDDEGDTVAGNYYVSDALYGVDGISYIGVAEPLTYQELLQLPDISSDFRNLKVIYRLDDKVLGSESVAYGASLDNLHYPELPGRTDSFGKWPDMSGKVMNGMLILEAEYYDTVHVVQGEKNDDGRVYAMAEGNFTSDAQLMAAVGLEESPASVQGRNNVVYDVKLIKGGINSSDTLTLRLLSPYENAEVYELKDGKWISVDSSAKGQYLQVESKGPNHTFCVAQKKKSYRKVYLGAGAAAAAVILAGVFKTTKKTVKKAKDKKKNQ